MAEAEHGSCRNRLQLKSPYNVWLPLSPPARTPRCVGPSLDSMAKSEQASP